MTQISASLVKELREKTGAGMMDCKNALTSANNDIEHAVKILREKGLARAAKKTSRIAAEGLIGIKVAGSKAAIVELNCETDFVARNDDFKSLVDDMAKTAINYAKTNALEVDGAELNDVPAASNGQQVQSLINDKIAVIGEKIALRRFAVLSNADVYGAYIHGAGSIGVLVAANLNDASLAKNTEVEQAMRDIAMHVAAASPLFIEESDIPSDWIKSEREIFTTQVRESGKPAEMIEKIVDGKMAKHKKDFCLLDQPFVKNPDQSVKDMLAVLTKNTGAKLEIRSMIRFKVGEGIEKLKDNLADEVRKMTE
jgi:elongation factor Ts